MHSVKCNLCVSWKIKGIGYLRVLFFIIEPRTTQHFVPGKFSIFGQEIGLRPKNLRELGLPAH